MTENGDSAKKSDAKTQQGLAVSARSIATKALIQNHQDEYDRLLGDARVSLGLPREKPSEDIQKLRDRVKTQQERLLKLQAELLKAEGK